MENRSKAWRIVLGPSVQTDEPLARHTTFRIGGPADLYVQSNNIAELVEWVNKARQNEIPVLILGHGSNVLVLDGGVRGLVVENHCDGFQLNIPSRDRALVQVESGASLPLIANRLARQGWAGLEWAIGVPGTLGGGIVGNAGAHGSTIADCLRSASVLGKDGSVRNWPKAEFEFGYRQSRFKHSRDEIILSAELELNRDDAQACIERMNQYTQQRRRTQPTEASVGSMFKNPPGHFAGQLIEQAGLKGTRVGNVQVSPKHANFFINLGGATANDVMQLIEQVQNAVKKQFAIALELEIELVGERSAL